MYNVPKDLLDAFRAAPDIYTSLLEGCTQEQAQSARGGDEDWSVVEVVCHLRDAEERALDRMRLMRDENEPFMEGYDQDAWARERDYASQDLRAALGQFFGLRAQHVKELEALSPEGWERPGNHEEEGRITISAQTLHLVAHDVQHAAQIARQLRPAGVASRG